MLQVPKDIEYVLNKINFMYVLIAGFSLPVSYD